ncbi:hypothetical protein WL1483_1813 [Aeromonas schubertii]|uniref:Uncharacterized protein n=1 Tax=Aeromonas schubertii TaxID=652 RepID=A0A0S2SHX6_9GAMM|nr:hypothetical protein WL1483_1813 [Aeromonas schubertii]
MFLFLKDDENMQRLERVRMDALLAGGIVAHLALPTEISPPDFGR